MEYNVENAARYALARMVLLAVEQEELPPEENENPSAAGYLFAEGEYDGDEMREKCREALMRQEHPEQFEQIHSGLVFYDVPEDVLEATQKRACELAVGLALLFNPDVREDPYVY
jgi:hypothetical protein